MPTSRIDSIDQNTTEKTPPNKETELTEIHNSLTNSFEEQLLKKTLSEIMNLLGIPNSYDDRYELIYQLYNAGIVIFEPTLNFFEASRPSLAEEKRKNSYAGTPSQNEKFKRAIIRNRHLFKDGKLPPENISKWK